MLLLLLLLLSISWTAEDERGVDAAVAAAVEAGVTLFDTAEAYDFPQGKASSERILAAALKPHGRAARGDCDCAFTHPDWAPVTFWSRSHRYR